MRQRLSLDIDYPLILARGIHKRFGRVTALDGLDLSVRAGEVHGFLGPNGAGKSTTIRALLGQLRLDGGELEVLGGHPVRDARTIHPRLAYVPGDTALWPSLTGGECIDLIAGFQGGQDRARRDELVDRFELDPRRRARTYSKGNRQKVALVAALSSTADLFVLDEPTSGLDPLMEAVFQQVVRELAEEGRTVLLSSHILDEVEALCDRVTIIRRGRTVSTGTLEDLRANTLTTVETTTAHGIRALSGVPGVTDVVERPVSRGTHTTFSTTHAALPAAVTLVARHEPASLVVRPPSLEELFLEHYDEVPA